MRLNSMALMAGWLVQLSVVVSMAADVRLVDAVKDGNVEAVRGLLKERVDVNAPQGDGTTPLHWAVQQDDLQTASLLIGAGAHVNVVNDNGVTPLYLACTNRSAAMVERLLMAGGKPNAQLVNGETVLMNCARTGDAGAVKALLARGANVNASERSRGQTALMWAVAQRHPAAVAALIEAGADINARSRVYDQTVSRDSPASADADYPRDIVQRGGSTALLFAARSGDVESARLLLAAGANVNDALPDGTSALVLAAHSNQSAVAMLLLDKGARPDHEAAGYTALHAAVLRGDLALVKALLAHGANPGPKITKGTPLRRSGTDFELPETLIGATPYFLAAKFLEAAIMPVLLSAGADPRVRLEDGTTPLMVAAGMGAGGARAGGLLDRRGFSVVDGATIEDESRVLEAVTVALDADGDVNAVNEAGDTALHFATSLGYDRVIRLLVHKGAQVNVRNKRGKTPLALLTGGKGPVRGAVDSLPQLSHQSTVELLRSLGATE